MKPKKRPEALPFPHLSAGSYYGEKIRQFSVGGLVLTETAFPPRLVIPAHTHENAFFCLVVRGVSTSMVEKRTRRCDASILTFHPPREPHSNTWDDDGACLTLELEASRHADLIERSVRLDQSAEFVETGTVALAFRLLNELREPDELSSLAIEGLALELLAACARHRLRRPLRAAPPWLGHARQLLRERFTQSLSLAEIAGAVGVHPSHLARSFRRHHDCSIGDFVRGLRVNFACRAIATSEMPLAQIALTAGFTDQSHFTRTFKRLMGITPAAYAALRPRSGRTRSRIALCKTGTLLQRILPALGD